jgi:hypothetical protein
MKFYRNPIWWAAVVIFFGGGALLLFWPTAEAVPLFALTGSDGRCTGFLNGIGRWDWSSCCRVHDVQAVASPASDGALALCLLESTPSWATPLVFLSCALMAFCRPIYNVLQRWGWAR